MAMKLCLLRGINVGGKNIIKMVDLKACFENLGFEKVETYIQSGNVIFDSKKTDASLTVLIEKALRKKFGYHEPVLLLSKKKLEAVISSAPKGFGDHPDKYQYDFIFTVPGMTARTFAKVVSLKEGVDSMHVGNGVVYFTRLKSKASKSHLSKVVSKPEYKQVTIRNWNTTTRLREKLNGNGI